MVEPMDDFERELREQLNVREAPEGFADRVMARVAEREKRPKLRLPVWRWAAVTALAAVVAMGVGLQHEREQRLQGEQARDQVLLALRITGTTLRDVERRIDKQSGRRDNAGNTLGDQKEY